MVRRSIVNRPDAEEGTAQLITAAVQSEELRWSFLLKHAHTHRRKAGDPALNDHNILDALVHLDSIAADVLRGAIIYGNATPKWARLVLGAEGTYPRSDGTDLVYFNPFAIDKGLTGFPNRDDSVLSWSSGDTTFTIAPSNGSFDYYIAGIKYTVSGADDIVIDDTTSGTHWIYYDGDTLSEMVNPSNTEIDTLIVDKCLVALVYWNATDSSYAILADERHGLVMSGETHHWLHDHVSSVWREGLTVSGYELNTRSDAALTFEVTDGRVYDEDVTHVIADGSAANQYEQQLNGGDASIPVLYRSGDPGYWKEQAASTLPYINAGDNTNLQYNSLAGSTWGQTGVGNNKYVVCSLIATNDWQYPIKMIQGNAQYDSKSDAVDGAQTEITAWGTMPSPEFVLLFRFVLQTGNYAGVKNAQIVDVTDFRGSSISGSGAVISDHGALSSLNDPTHHPWVAVGDNNNRILSFLGA